MRRTVLWVVSVLLAAGVGLAAGWLAFTPPPAPVEEAPLQTVRVTEGELGRTVAVSVSASWPVTTTVLAQGQGTITSLELDPGAQVSAGEALLTVDLRPVLAAQGDIPAFRDLARGDRGRDVAQLQEFLAQLGHYGGAADGAFGPSTTAAVQRWQRDIGVEADGRVRRGDLVYVPELPSRVTLAEEIAVGAPLTPGQPLGRVLGTRPQFAVTVSDNATQPPPQAEVEVQGPEGEVWTGQLSATTPTSGPDDPDQSVPLVAIEEEPLCGDACDLVPGEGSTTYPGRATLIPQQRGPLVPVAAIATKPDGRTILLTPEGDEIDIEILVTDGSHAVVDGIEPGEEVRLFGDVDTAPASPNTDGSSVGDADSDEARRQEGVVEGG